MIGELCRDIVVFEYFDESSLCLRARCYNPQEAVEVILLVLVSRGDDTALSHRRQVVIMANIV